MKPEELRSKLREVREEDRGNLITVSYSKLDTFENCQRRYEKQYNEKKFTDSATLPLELGNILHKGLEMKGTAIMEGRSVDYEDIRRNVMNGCDEVTDKNSEHMYGVEEIKERYSKDWLDSSLDVENKSYDEKIRIYLDTVLPTRMDSEEWNILGVEQSFEFVYDERCIIHGFIDRVDENVEDGSLKVTDYKSSKKVFPDTKIKTPLQMVVYDLACLFLYDKVPSWHTYDFILLNKMQTTADGVCSKGYLNRGLKKLNKLLDEIDECTEEDEFSPCPTPLCYWCPYAPKSHTPNADEKYGGECQYYSLWTPENKIFAVNKEYVIGEEEEEKPVRRLSFDQF